MSVLKTSERVAKRAPRDRRPRALLRDAVRGTAGNSLVASAYWRLIGNRLRAEPLRYLLIVCPMRSGSSLLLHLLLTSPEIAGYAETFTTYSGKRDLDVLGLKVMYHRRSALRRERFAMDKLVHNELLPDPSVLADERVHTLFLMREPEANLRSMIRAPQIPGWNQLPGWNASEIDADFLMRYYTERMAALADYARIAGGERASVISYERLLADTGAVFEGVESRLGLEHGLSESYELLPETGSRGGDPSEHLKKGFIDRKISRADVEVDPLMIEQASEAYRACWDELSRRCEVLG